ncbi:hypothetical protein CDAR_479861 [Caerostris darwini]|uniref:Uncharacterized protein n=1 Tax=Caerostris darwini TaxID=1538125 RepID=A0AAV4SNX1_9ARAC|nr:hypothetical protein CDAR_479861 [Caerostris darwini]
MHYSQQFDNHCPQSYPYTTDADRGQPLPLSLPMSFRAVQLRSLLTQIMMKGGGGKGGGQIWKMHYSQQFDNHCPQSYPYTTDADRGQPLPLSLPMSFRAVQLRSLLTQIMMKGGGGKGGGQIVSASPLHQSCN